MAGLVRRWWRGLDVRVRTSVVAAPVLLGVGVLLMQTVAPTFDPAGWLVAVTTGATLGPVLTEMVKWHVRRHEVPCTCDEGVSDL